MNKRAYFLACLNVHLARLSKPWVVAVIQSSAWRLPEESIPDDPARAAFEFYEYFDVLGSPAPEWLVAWEDSRTA